MIYSTGTGTRSVCDALNIKVEQSKHNELTRMFERPSQKKIQLYRDVSVSDEDGNTVEG